MTSTDSATESSADSILGNKTDSGQQLSRSVQDAAQNRDSEWFKQPMDASVSNVTTNTNQIFHDSTSPSNIASTLSATTDNIQPTDTGSTLQNISSILSDTSKLFTDIMQTDNGQLSAGNLQLIESGLNLDSAVLNFASNLVGNAPNSDVSIATQTSDASAGTTGATQTADASAGTTGATQTSDASAGTTGATQTSDASAGTTGATQTADASAGTTGATQTADASAGTTGATQTADASAGTTGATQTSDASAGTTGATQTSDASAGTTAATQTADASAGTTGGTQTADATAGTTGATQTADASAGTTGATQTADATAGTTGATQTADASAGTTGATQTADATAGTTGATQTADASAGTTGATQTADATAGDATATDQGSGASSAATGTESTSSSNGNSFIAAYSSPLGTPDEANSMSQVLGTTVSPADYVDMTQPESADAPYVVGNYQAWAQQHPGSPVVLGVPLTFQGQTLADTANGSDVSEFTDLAQQLVNGGMGNAVIRLGWEMNGDWYPWGGDPQNFIAAYNNAAEAMKSVPGANFQFDWNVAAGPSANGTQFSDYYPGDQNVDIIGTDAYDQDYEPGNSPQQRWQNVLNEPGGLEDILNFAEQHDKPFSVPEWGLPSTSNAGGAADGGGDDPYYINQMAAFFKSVPDLSFQAFFQDPANQYDSLEEDPNSYAAYVNDFSQTSSGAA